MLAVAVLAYLVLGMVFALWFFVRGHRSIDPSSADAAWYTRLLWFPGAMLLWPVLLTAAIRRDGSVET